MLVEISRCSIIANQISIIQLPIDKADKKSYATVYVWPSTMKETHALCNLQKPRVQDNTKENKNKKRKPK